MSSMNQNNSTDDNDNTVTVISDGGGSGVKADVNLISGKNRLAVDSLTQVEELLGETVFPQTYITIDVVGAIGDTLKTDIAAPSAVSVTTTVVSGDSDNDFAKRHRDELNADGNFSSLYKATTPRDSHLVCIQSLLIQTTREIAGDVAITLTGSMAATLGFDVIVVQPLPLALFPASQDCRKGTISVQGIIGIVESGRPPKRLLLESSSSLPGQGGPNPLADQSIDGSSTDRVFTLSNNSSFDTSRDFLVTELRIESTAGSMQLGAEKYIEVSELSTGHLFEVRSDGNLEYNENLKLMEDIHHAFAFGGGSKFDLITGSGDVSLVAVFSRPFFIRKTGTFATDDDVMVTVRDDLSSTSIGRLQVSAVGFFEE